MGKRFLKQQFYKSNAIASLCEEIRALALAQLGFMAGWQAGSQADEMVLSLTS